MVAELHWSPHMWRMLEWLLSGQYMLASITSINEVGKVLYSGFSSVTLWVSFGNSKGNWRKPRRQDPSNFINICRIISIWNLNLHGIFWFWLCPSNVLQYKSKKVKHRSDNELTKDTPYLALKGELWCFFSFGERIPRHIESVLCLIPWALYFSLYPSSPLRHTPRVTQLQRRQTPYWQKQTHHPCCSRSSGRHRHHLGNDTARWRYNTVNSLRIPHIWHPIARPWGRDMGCVLWV